MGRIIATIKITNIFDEMDAKRGYIQTDGVRSIKVEALADSGATMLCLKQNVIEQLGLPFLEEKRAGTANGVVMRKIYDGAKMTLKGRTATFDVMEVPEDCPNLIGQIPLERLDFILDLAEQQIIPNPAHDGEFQLDMY